jgi:hypothetical protein
VLIQQDREELDRAAEADVDANESVDATVEMEVEMNEEGDY